MSLSRSRLPIDLTRHAWRLGIAVALAAAALVLCGAATAAPAAGADAARGAHRARAVHRGRGRQSGDRPAGAVGGTAHGYGSGTNYRVSASATPTIRETRAPVFAHAGVRVADRTAADALRAVPDSARHHARSGDRKAARPTSACSSCSRSTNSNPPPTAADPAARSTIRTRGCSRTSARSTSSRRTTSAAAPAFAWPSSTPASTPTIPISPAARSVTRNYIDNDDVAFRSDRHGTQVAGLIAAAANNGIGIVGVAPDVKLLAYKACWQASAEQRRPLQFLHHRAGAGRCARRQGAGHQPESRRARAIRCSRRWSRKAIAAGRHRRGRGVRRSALRLSRRKLPRVLPVAEAETSPEPAATTSCARRRATSSRWCPTATTISRPAARSPPRRSAAWSRCCWRAIRSSASTRLRELLHAVHRETRHHARTVSLRERLHGAGAGGARRDLRAANAEFTVRRTRSGFVRRSRIDS